MTMGKKVKRILDLLEARAVECDAGKPVYHFDVESGVGGAELKRHAKRLRALAREIKEGGRE